MAEIRERSKCIVVNREMKGKQEFVTNFVSCHYCCYSHQRFLNDHIKPNKSRKPIQPRMFADNTKDRDDYSTQAVLETDIF